MQRARAIKRIGYCHRFEDFIFAVFFFSFYDEGKTKLVQRILLLFFYCCVCVLVKVVSALQFNSIKGVLLLKISVVHTVTVKAV